MPEYTYIGVHLAMHLIWQRDFDCQWHLKKYVPKFILFIVSSYLRQRFKVNLNIMTFKYGFFYMPKANKIP